MAQKQPVDPIAVQFLTADKKGWIKGLPPDAAYFTEEVIEQNGVGDRPTAYYRRHEIRWREELPVELVGGKRLSSPESGTQPSQ